MNAILDYLYYKLAAIAESHCNDVGNGYYTLYVRQFGPLSVLSFVEYGGHRGYVSIKLFGKRLFQIGYDVYWYYDQENVSFYQIRVGK